MQVKKQTFLTCQENFDGKKYTLDIIVKGEKK